MNFWGDSCKSIRFLNARHHLRTTFDTVTSTIFFVTIDRESGDAHDQEPFDRIDFFASVPIAWRLACRVGE